MKCCTWCAEHKSLHRRVRTIYSLIPDKHRRRASDRSLSRKSRDRPPVTSTVRRNSPVCIWWTLLIVVDQTVTRRPSVRAAYLPNYARSSHGPWTRMQITRTSSCQHELSTIHRALNCSCCRRYYCCRGCCCHRCWYTIRAGGSCKSSASDFEDFVVVWRPIIISISATPQKIIRFIYRIFLGESKRVTQETPCDRSVRLNIADAYEK